MKEISGNVVDLKNRRVYPGTLRIKNGRVVDIVGGGRFSNFIIPPFVDSHIHVESSMVVPSEFSRAVSIHGVISTVSDPHEIGNVLGIEGVKYMVKNARMAPLKIYFSAPSCVPASPFETNGARIGVEEVRELLVLDSIKSLGEVMNFPAVIRGESEIIQKIETAKALGKPIDGHAPGLRGEGLRKYVSAGISTDHECTTEEEALEKILLGMKIQIREGSAAKNFNALIEILDKHFESCMFCSDDKHPDDLLKGSIDDLVRRAVSEGINVMKVLTAASLNPIVHYKLDVGLLQKGDPADFLIVDDLKEFNILEVYSKGKPVAKDGRTSIERIEVESVNNFSCSKKRVSDFSIKKEGERIRVIVASNGQLVTGEEILKPKVENGYAVSDVERDILKIAVVNRYKDAPVSLGFVKGFGLKGGAIASSVAHDAHNIVAVGTNDEDLCRAVNLVIESKGGLSAVCGNKEFILPLPVAGLMSDDDIFNVAKNYKNINNFVKGVLGSSLDAPFMTLSFMALEVIPKLKITDLGLFDVENFRFADLWYE